MYLISKTELLHLLARSTELEVLTRDGVDNWEWYMEGKKAMMEEYFGADMDFQDAAELMLENFTEIPSGDEIE